MWQDAMADLNEQLHVEGIDEEDDGRKAVSPSPSIPKYSHSDFLFILFSGFPRCHDLPGLPTLRLFVHQISPNLPSPGELLRLHDPSTKENSCKEHSRTCDSSNHRIET
jgi:hypothetical protein